MNPKDSPAMARLLELTPISAIETRDYAVGLLSPPDRIDMSKAEAAKVAHTVTLVEYDMASWNEDEMEDCTSIYARDSEADACLYLLDPKADASA
jgi:hypothetical protein